MRWSEGRKKIKIIFVWDIYSRRLTVKLTYEYYKDWSRDITNVLEKIGARRKYMVSIEVILNHAAFITPIG